MIKTIVLIIVLTFACLGHSQDFEKEIKNLKTPEEIEKYWNNLKDLDQSKRGLSTNDTLDNNNFKKVILLIKYHGYPKGSRIPNIIVTHQRSRNVNEYYFPIFYQAYKNGEADSGWFYHILRAVHRQRYGRDFIRGRKIDAKNVDTIMGRMQPYLNPKVDLSIIKFDSLYNKYISNLKAITSSEAMHSWITADKSHCFFYKFQDKLYYYMLWQDNSSSFPQEIKFNKEKNQYEYADSFANDYFIVDENKNLQIFQSGKLKLDAKIE